MSCWARCQQFRQPELFARFAAVPLHCMQPWRSHRCRCTVSGTATGAPVGNGNDTLEADDNGVDADASDPPIKSSGLSSLLRRRKDQRLKAGLYVVATPIGNLEDITVRALSVLSAADTVLAEDCRRTRILLNAYGLTAHLRSYHMHNETQRASEVVRLLQQGQIVALVSDAGTPGISDPGSVAITAAIDAGHQVVVVPGPAACIAALVGSGLPTSEFHFVGFLPAKSAARKRALHSLRERVSATIIFYVPPHGLTSTLADMVEVLGPNRSCCVTRELTKIHETFHRASLADALSHFAASDVKGEVTLCVQGSTADEMQSNEQKQVPEERIQELLRQGVSVSALSKQVAKEFGMHKKESYALALECAARLKGDQTGRSTTE